MKVKRADRERWRRHLYVHSGDFVNLLLDALDAADAVVSSQWEHRCSDRVGGCTAVSAAALAAYRERVEG